MRTLRCCQRIIPISLKAYSPRRHEEHGEEPFFLIQCIENFVFSAIAPALLNHKDVVNAENAGAVFCLPPASVQSSVSFVVSLLNRLLSQSHTLRCSCLPSFNQSIFSTLAPRIFPIFSSINASFACSNANV